MKTTESAPAATIFNRKSEFHSVLPREEQALRNGLTWGSGPTGWSIDRRAIPEKADTYPLSPDERQRKEELVHSISTKAPARTTPRAGQFVLVIQTPGAPPSLVPRRAYTSFSLLDRARPVFSFSSGRKRENGGCDAPAIIMADPPTHGTYSKTGRIVFL